MGAKIWWVLGAAWCCSITQTRIILRTDGVEHAGVGAALADRHFGVSADTPIIPPTPGEFNEQDTRDPSPPLSD